MPSYALNAILEDLKQELISTEVKSKEIGSRFEALYREIESMKVDALQSLIEEQRKSAARDRGIASLLKNKRKVRNSLLVAAGSFVIGALLTRDKLGALAAGMSGFDGMVQGLGESKWYVSLGKTISVLPCEEISQQATWMTLDSFNEMMEELKKKALAGEKLETLDNVLSKLKKNRG